MAQKTITSRQRQKYDTSTNWTNNNPILLSGEIGIESDTKKMKVGDGSTAWNSLKYITIDNLDKLVTTNTEQNIESEKTFENTITFTKGSGRYLDANNGAVPIVLDRTGGQFNMLANMKSTNGVFCFGTYQNRFMITYTSNDTIEADHNAVDKQWWFNEDGSLTLINNKDASGSSYNGPALVIGGTQNQAHIEIDSNEIMAKSNATTPTALFLNSDGGEVFIGSSSNGYHFVTNLGSNNFFGPVIDKGVSLGNSEYRWLNAYLTNLNVSGGSTSVPTPPTNDNSTKIANTEWVNNAINNAITEARSIVKLNTDTQIWTLEDGIYYVNKNIKLYYNSSTSFSNPFGISILQVNRVTVSTTQIDINFIVSWSGNTNGETSFYGTADETSGNIVFYNGITSDGIEAPTPSSNDTNSNRVVTIGWIRNNICPAGTVVAFAGSTIPSGWLLCDGSIVDKTDFPNLFNAIGTTYGSGDTSNEFKLPNLIDKFIEGSSTVGTEISAGLPNITGELTDNLFGNNVTSLDYDSGAFVKPTSTSNDRYINWTDTNREAGFTNITFNASKSNTIYGKSTTVQPPALTMQYIIKY